MRVNSERVPVAGAGLKVHYKTSEVRSDRNRSTASDPSARQPLLPTQITVVGLPVVFLIRSLALLLVGEESIASNS
jgi:hypothetical protein